MWIITVLSRRASECLLVLQPQGTRSIICRKPGYSSLAARNGFHRVSLGHFWRADMLVVWLRNFLWQSSQLRHVNRSSVWLGGIAAIAQNEMDGALILRCLALRQGQLFRFLRRNQQGHHAHVFRLAIGIRIGLGARGQYLYVLEHGMGGGGGVAFSSQCHQHIHMGPRENEAGNVHHLIGFHRGGPHAVRDLCGEAEASAGSQAMFLQRLFGSQGINRNVANGILFLLDKPFQRNIDRPIYLSKAFRGEWDTRLYFSRCRYDALSLHVRGRLRTRYATVKN